MRKLASELEVGDEIVGRLGCVNKVEHNVCGANKVHVNNNACYEGSTEVEIKLVPTVTKN